MAWWHGTALENVAGILAEGFRGRKERGRKALDPLPGRVYLARELPYALSYTFGGLVEHQASAEHPAGWFVHGRRDVGGVVAVEPDLTRCVPDEDWLGKGLAEFHYRGVFQKWTPDVLRVYDRMPPRVKQNWKKVPQHKLGDYSVWARMGKTAINHLDKTREGRALLTDVASRADTIACEGEAVHPVSAWKLSRSALPRPGDKPLKKGWLLPTGENLDDIAVRVM